MHNCLHRYTVEVPHANAHESVSGDDEGLTERCQCEEQKDTELSDLLYGESRGAQPTSKHSRGKAFDSWHLTGVDGLATFVASKYRSLKTVFG